MLAGSHMQKTGHRAIDVNDNKLNAGSRAREAGSTLATLFAECIWLKQ